MAEEVCERETTRSSVAGDDDIELVARAKSDPHAFERLYDLYYGRILNYIYRRTMDVALAEDLTSNTFFKAFRALPGYDNRGKFGPWLFRIACNEIRLHWRAERNRHESDHRWREDFARLKFSDSAATDAEQFEENVRQFARLHDAMSRLPERYQSVLTLRYFERMSYEEVANVLDKRIGTVKSLLHRGLRQLRRHFEKDGATFQQDLHFQVQEESER